MMKPTYLVLFLLLAVSAAAAIDISEETINLNVNYDKFREGDKTIGVTTSTITLTNSETADTNVQVALTGLPTEYTFEGKSVTVPANGTTTTNIVVRVPHSQSPGSKTIGTVSVTSAGSELTTAPLNQKTAYMVEFEKVEVNFVDVDGNDERETFDESDEEFKVGENALVGTEVTFMFRVKNLFDDRDYRYSDLENIELRIEVDDDQIYAGSFDETHDLDDLKANEKQEYEVTFEIDEEADDQEYVFEITLEAEDEKGITYLIERELHFEVERKRDDVRISKADYTTTCSKLTLSLEAKNYGTRDQRYAAVNIFSTDLGIDEKIDVIKIDRFGDKDTWNSKFTFDVKPGSYQIDVNAFVKNDEHTDFERIDVVVPACALPVVPITVPEPVANNTVTGAVVNDPVITSVLDTEVIKTVEKSYDTQRLIVGGLAVVVVLLIVMIGLFVAILLKE